MEKRNERSLYIYVLTVLVLIFATGVFVGGPGVLRRAVLLQIEPARLLRDFFAVVGIGATLVNAALVAAIGLAIIRFVDVRLSGPTIAAVFTLLGFGLFGKTVLNTVPIIIGVAIAARIAKKRFVEYVLIALFGTALGPVVTMVAVEIAAPPVGILLSVVGGLGVGILLPPVAIAMLRFHQGYSLYNIGLASGFLGIFVAAFVSIAPNVDPPGLLDWTTEIPLGVTLALPVLGVSLVVFGLVTGGIRTSFRDFRRIMSTSGRLPSDYFDIAGPAGTLLNMGVMTLFSWVAVLVVGAPLNGPVIGSILTLCGFAAFGNHLKNSIPVMVGVLAAAVLFGIDPASPGPILAFVFVTTLSPVAGEFGPVAGVLAGAIHLTLVMQTGSWHRGLTLYNNGFAGGLTATLFVAVVEWYRSTRESSPRKEGR